MLSNRKIEERNARKAQILSGALKVFKIHGIDKTTMDEVAHESGFGKATLYYYYASKDEVLSIGGGPSDYDTKKCIDFVTQEITKII